jgi:hypothetical protein
MEVNLPGGSFSLPSSGNHRGVMKYFAGLIALVALVAGSTVLGYEYFQNEIDTRTGGSAADGGVIEADTTLPGIPNEKQVIVFGSITTLHVEGAILRSLEMPLTITTPGRGDGSGASIQGVTVNGESTQIEWDAGTPLTMDGEGGALVTGPVTLDADGVNTTVSLGIDPFGFVQATYAIHSSVAVGSGSLARAADSVTFSAGDGSSVVFRGDAATTFPTRSLASKGSGRVVITGDLTLVKPDKSLTKVTSATLDDGQFDLSITSEGSVLTIKVTLQGTVATA